MKLIVMVLKIVIVFDFYGIFFFIDFIVSILVKIFFDEDIVLIVVIYVCWL